MIDIVIGIIFGFGFSLFYTHEAKEIKKEPIILCSKACGIDMLEEYNGFHDSCKCKGGE